MPDHVVTLHYTPNPDPARKPLFQPQPNPIFVKHYHTIAFRKADDSVAGTIHIAFHNPAMFSSPTNNGTGEVQVTGTPVATTYHCQLLGPNGVTIAESSEHEGGDIVPDPPSP
jgi:hypothetical protein